MRSPPRPRALLGLTFAVGLGACRGASPHSPEALHRAYLEAVANNDVDAAYALLAPEVQAEIDREAFERRWTRDARERATWANPKDRSRKAAVARQDAITVHPGGRTITWTRTGEHYQVVHGLPGLPRTDTPAAAIRALLAALRDGDLARLHAVASPDLLARMRESWGARAEAIESALEQPDGLHVSEDGQRAELRYRASEAIRLEQTAGGWRVTSLE